MDRSIRTVDDGTKHHAGLVTREADRWTAGAATPVYANERALG